MKLSLSRMCFLLHSLANWITSKTWRILIRDDYIKANLKITFSLIVPEKTFFSSKIEISKLSFLKKFILSFSRLERTLSWLEIYTFRESVLYIQGVSNSLKVRLKF